MTVKMFWEDPYLTQTAARVTAVNGAQLELDRTILFAESGGQESDHGTIGGHTVLSARWVGHSIVYSLANDHGLSIGESVTVEIDWQRRYRLMRLHFAAEIVLELAYQMLGNPAKIGAHIAEDKARIDFAWQGSIAPHLPGLEKAANAIVLADHAITSGYEDVANERRFWKIPEFAAVPCGGTHLRRTAEIGRITLKRRNLGKDKERIEILVG